MTVGGWFLAVLFALVVLGTLALLGSRALDLARRGAAARDRRRARLDERP